MHTDFGTDVRLEYFSAVEGVSACYTKGKLEHRMLLVGVQSGAVAELECLAWNVLVVAMVGQESADCNVWSDEISAFEVHAPSAALVGKVNADREVVLPVDVEVG